MSAYKNKGNISILAVLFLSMAVLFFSSIYKIMNLDIKKNSNIIVSKSAIELEEKRYYILKVVQDYINKIDKLEFNKEISFENSNINKILKDKYAIGNLKFKLLENKSGLIRFKNLGNNKQEEFDIYYKKENLCTCNKSNCEFDSEKLILIPKRRFQWKK